MSEHGTPRTQYVDPEVLKVEWIQTRMERQTLQRFARSGAVVFTIIWYSTPMGWLGPELGVLSRLESTLQSTGQMIWQDTMARCGSGWWFGLLDYLERLENWLCA